MKIALYHNLPSGGAKRTLHETVKRLSANHRLDVYTLSSANHNFADLRPYVASYKIYTFKNFPLLSSPLGRLNQAIRILDLLKLSFLSQTISQKINQGNYDVVLVHPCRFETCPSILRYIHGIPSIYYCHEPLRLMYEAMPNRPYDDKHYIHRRVLNRVDLLPVIYRRVVKRNDQRNIRSAHMVLVNSKFICDVVRRIYHVSPRVSYHGVDTHLFRPKTVEKRQIILSVGSLTSLKGFDFLIQAVAGIPLWFRPTLIIVSNFENPLERLYLEELSNHLNVEVKLLANVSDEQLVNLYNQAKITVYTPIREPFGLVPLESMACETPVIAVREGGIKETVVDGYNGKLVERDVLQLTTAIKQFLLNPDMALEYGRNGRKYVIRNWTWKQATMTLENYLMTSVKTVKHLL